MQTRPAGNKVKMIMLYCMRLPCNRNYSVRSILHSQISIIGLSVDAYHKDAIKSFSDEQENANTKKKTSSDLKTINEMLASEGLKRREESSKFHQTSCENLRKSLSWSQKEKWRLVYEPSSMRRFQQSVDRYLRKRDICCYY